MPLGGRPIDPQVLSEPRGGGFREHLDLSDVVDKYEVFNPALAKKNAQERSRRTSMIA